LLADHYESSLADGDATSAELEINAIMALKPGQKVNLNDERDLWIVTRMK
jgi:hypothetical protein